MNSDDLKAVLGFFLIVLVGLIIYLTWPIFPILVLSIISWGFVKRHKSVWSKAVALDKYIFAAFVGDDKAPHDSGIYLSRASRPAPTEPRIT